jgi:hypothetical protein
MASTVVMSILIFVLGGIVFAYVSPRAEARLEKVFVATLGALVGSLSGRVLSDPQWVGHLFYVAAGAFMFSAFDWMKRRHRAGGYGLAKRR